MDFDLAPLNVYKFMFSRIPVMLLKNSADSEKQQQLDANIENFLKWEYQAKTVGYLVGLAQGAWHHHHPP